jgi:hypothetical protein
MDGIRTVAVIGAGPVGLAAAAHLLERGLDPVVLEAGPTVAHGMRQWSHVRLFSPWGYNIDNAAGRLLAPTGWNSPEPQAYPTGGELVESYLEPLATRTALKTHIKTAARVTGIGRVGLDKVRTAGRALAPFELRYRNGAGDETFLADAVIDASGTWFSPNPAGASGLPAIGEDAARDRIAYGMPDVLGAQRARYAGKVVAVLGAGHSAAGTLIELAALARDVPETRIVWLLRGDDPAKSFGGGASDKLVARGAVGLTLANLVAKGGLHVETDFRVTRIEPAAHRLRIAAIMAGHTRDVVVDELIVATGFRPDLGFLRELRLALDPALECPPALAPLIDPNEHSCGTVRPHGALELAQPEPNFYIAGMKSYGRAPTFLMLTGYEQVRSIAAELAGDRKAARRVDLVLPETGVCNVTAAAPSSGCCGGPPQSDASACCAADETARQGKPAPAVAPRGMAAAAPKS